MRVQIYENEGLYFIKLNNKGQVFHDGNDHESLYCNVPDELVKDYLDTYLKFKYISNELKRIKENDNKQY